MYKLVKQLNVSKVLILLSAHSVFNSFVDIFIFYGIGKLLLDDNEEQIFIYFDSNDLNILLIIAIAVRLFSNTVFERIKSKSIWHLYKQIATTFVEKKLLFDFWYHKGIDKGIILRKLTKDIPHVGFVFQSLINIITDSFFASTIILFLIIDQPIITLILLPTILIISVIIKKSLSLNIKLSSEKRLKSDEFIKKWILTFKSSLEQVESIFASKVIAKKIKDQINLRYLAGKSQVFLTDLTRILSENSILFVIMIGLFVLPSEKNKELIWILPLLVRIIPNISRINTSFSTLSFYNKEVTDIIEEINSKTSSPILFNGNIKKDNTNFNVHVKKLKYISHEKPLLKDFNFSIPLNKVTFLFGNSGCGKSTLARVLVEKTKSKKDNFVFLPQSPTIFPDTLKFNVCLDKNINNTKILKVLESVNLFPESEGLSLNSIISDDDLSGGQMQRISIARSIYYDGKNIILDEPTNNLDKLAKIELKNVIKNLLRLNNTFLIISHDLDFISLFEDSNVIKINSSLQQ